MQRATLLTWILGGYMDWVMSLNTLMLSVRPGSHFEVINLEKMYEFERFRSILIIFEVHATDNTAQLRFCGGYRLRWVPPTPIWYWFDLRTTSELYALRKNDKSSSDFNPLWSFLKFMLRERMLSWASARVIDLNRILPTPLTFLHSLCIIRGSPLKWDSLKGALELGVFFDFWNFCF